MFGDKTIFDGDFSSPMHLYNGGELPLREIRRMEIAAAAGKSVEDVRRDTHSRVKHSSQRLSKK